MVGVPFLVTRWLSGPSARIGWPCLCDLRQAMMRGPDQEADEQRRHHRAARAERQIAEQVERREIVGERVEYDTASASPFAPQPAGAAMSRGHSSMRLPCEPFTITTSPGRSAVATIAANAAASRHGRRAVAAAAPACERAHLAAGGEDQVDARLGNGAASSAWSCRRLLARVPACRRARRCAGRPCRARGAEHGDGRAHRGRAGVVALVDQLGCARRHRDAVALAAARRAAFMLRHGARRRRRRRRPARLDRGQNGELVHHPMAAGRRRCSSR